MTLGGAAIGNAAIGSAPEPEEIRFEELSHQEFEKLYTDVYDRLDEVNQHLESMQTKQTNWRRRSWIWRFCSFLIGFGVGVFL